MTNHNIRKPRLNARDMLAIDEFSKRLAYMMDDFITELGIGIAERDMPLEDGVPELKQEDYAFLDVMPAIADILFRKLKEDI